MNIYKKIFLLIAFYLFSTKSTRLAATVDDSRHQRPQGKTRERSEHQRPQD
jgi:hypothetical protein